VVDDGSTDDTLEVAQRFIGPQLSVMACRRQGVIAARNAGLAKTDADAFGFCDPSDVWKPEKHLMHLCQNQEVGVSFAELLDIGNTDQPDTAQPKPRRVNMTAAYVFRHNPLRHKSGSVIRRESLKALMLKPKNASPHNQGFDETLEEYAKQNAWLRLLLTTGWSIEGLPSPFVTHKFTNAKTGAPTDHQRQLWHQMVKRLAPLAPAFFARNRPGARAAHEKGYGPHIVKSDPTHTRRFAPGNAGVRPSPDSDFRRGTEG